jgi:homoserine dehydrogenase
MDQSVLRVGLFGGGVVGGGVYELVRKYTQNLRLKGLGVSLEIVKICVKHLEKVRDFQIDVSRTKLVTDYNEILEDNSINCVIELIGGITDAKDVVFRAIQARKHVITANKALIANFLPEIQSELSKQPTVK